MPENFAPGAMSLASTIDLVGLVMPRHSSGWSRPTIGGSGSALSMHGGRTVFVRMAGYDKWSEADPYYPPFTITVEEIKLISIYAATLVLPGEK
ncbi:MAG: hypothetical protein VYD25_13145 [Pseudomonadota bacterium]|nr:hypothetical protein [Pseudomonadota bacterium]